MSKDTFSAREMEVLALAWQCMETEPKIDFDKLAVLAGYSRGSASVTFGKIKRKLKAHAEVNDTANDGTPNTTPKKATTAKQPKTPKSGGKRAAGGPGTDEPASKKKKKVVKEPTPAPSDDEESSQFQVKREDTGELLMEASELFRQEPVFQAGGYGFNAELEDNI